MIEKLYEKINDYIQKYGLKVLVQIEQNDICQRFYFIFNYKNYYKRVAIILEELNDYNLIIYESMLEKEVQNFIKKVDNVWKN